MNEELHRLAADLRATFVDLRFEITSFSSGGAMLDIWLDGRFIVVQATPDGDYVADDDPAARPFSSGHAFTTRDLGAVRQWLVDKLTRS